MSVHTETDDSPFDSKVIYYTIMINVTLDLVSNFKKLLFSLTNLI